jgi:chromosome segregation protein
LQFTRLRITGFKSFVDQTDLVIEPGLTGVVGPNGCGKSNLVEALRWVMGESSARQMRGGEMDDVIFGGTTTRPARNIAQVVLSIDTRDGSAPAGFTEAEELEINRSIARDRGSTFKINGREVRARDVQLMFADVATGAHSPSMVSQGRVGALINARPSDRRAILEDAAGIAGLHARRHEAELRLAAADTNLTRVDDVLATLDQQRQSLARQAKQAVRYRTISDQLRRVEASLLAVQWAEAERARSEHATALRRADEIVAEMTARSAAAATLQAETAARLPGLREAATVAGTALQALVAAANELDSEMRRIDAAQRAVADQMTQLDRDSAREASLSGDAAAATQRLELEASEITASRAGEQIARDEASSAVERTRLAVEQAEARWAELSQSLAAEKARRAAQERRIAELQQRDRRLTEEQTKLQAERARLMQNGDPAGPIEQGEKAIAEALARFEQAAQAARNALDRRQVAATEEATALQAVQAQDGALAKLNGEIAGLTASLTPQTKAATGTPIVDQVTAEPGFEAALGGALGDDLLAPLFVAGTNKLGWSEVSGDTAQADLPGGVASLAQHVTAPTALQRRLQSIGVVNDEAQGFALWPKLAMGQRLVSRNGDLWRWDGFHRAAGATHATATRLTQRNRLTSLEAAKAAADEVRATLGHALQQARNVVAEAQSDERTARQEEATANAALGNLRTQQARLVNEAANARARLASLDGSLTRLATERAEVERGLADAQGGSGGVDLAAMEAEVTAGRDGVTALRAELAQAVATLDRLAREAQERARRLSVIEIDMKGWKTRSDATAERLADIAGRRQRAQAEREALLALPQQIAQRREKLVVEIEQGEALRREASDALVAAETSLANQDGTLRQAEREVAAAREGRIRVEAELNQAIRHATEVAQRIQQRLECRPDQVRAVAEIGPDDELGLEEQLQGKFDRLSRERDTLGAVNLRAETEAEEVEQQIATLEAEKNELLQAIAKLRSAIAALNRDGRERLLASFETVNGHFQELFVRLFGGGKATLELTQSEDPLAAGLEILASPPGKRLQSLTLLSGGEQALTALALIFAVFLTNPSPICVLDEVDAPLDDSNVDRFCSLLGDIAATTATRFLVVTHHRMTMTRMDRLFGVTMAERGISQLVSVDLVRADRLMATA